MLDIIKTGGVRTGGVWTGGVRTGGVRTGTRLRWKNKRADGREEAVEAGGVDR